ncbi:hypothetical protein CLV92_1064 [Kineococcus xinjiangensis]|uniref:Uncharacterized protein n=1 Tax=Kineococcus xinjiangensis TaxID=512762 RepID=A0A2S6ILS2_9ACTN|nr:hypothetical protein CLV92_1064 [Kineococcus xinjiangensis]
MRCTPRRSRARRGPRMQDVPHEKEPHVSEHVLAPADGPGTPGTRSTGPVSAVV